MSGKWRFLAGGTALIITVGLLLTFGFVMDQAATTGSTNDGSTMGAPLDGAGGMGYDDETAASEASRDSLAVEIPWQVGVLIFFVGSSAALFALFARLRPDDVLEGARKNIYEHIEHNPGDHLAGITKAMGISSSSVRHHLDVLEWSELIVTHKDGKLRHYYPNRNGYRIYTSGSGYKEVLAALRNPTAREMVKLLMSNERANQRDIAAALGLHPSTVNWHAGRLISAGVMSKSREGKDIRYTLNREIDLAKVILLVEGDADLVPGQPASAEGASS